MRKLQKLSVMKITKQGNVTVRDETTLDLEPEEASAGR